MISKKGKEEEIYAQLFITQHEAEQSFVWERLVIAMKELVWG